jgi:hypothetical protein
VLESVAESSLVYAVGRVTHHAETIGLVLSESSLEVCSIPVEDLPLSFLHSVAVHSHEAIPITMGHLGRPIHHSSLPRALDPHLSRKQIIGPPAIPEVVLPLALINLSSGHVVVHAHAVLHLVDEGALVLVTTPVEVTTLDEGRCTQGLALEAVSIGIVDQGLTHHC